MNDTKSSIRKFLGAESLEIGPFGLLGIDPRQCTQAIVEAALQRQLDRLSAHPEGDTPEADEVRLALHAAAAQLLDPRVRDHLAERWRPEAERRGANPVAPAAPGKPAQSSQRKATVVGPRSPRDLREEFGSRHRDDHLAKYIVGGAVVAVALIGMVIAAILVLASPPAPPAPPVAPGGAGTVAGGAGSGAAAPGTVSPADDVALAPPDYSEAAASAAPIDASGQAGATDPNARRASRNAFVDPRKTLKELRDATAAVRTDPAAAVTRLEPVLAQLADWWASYEPGVRRACDDAVVEALYALAPSPELQEQLHAMIARGALRMSTDRNDALRPRLHADDVWPAAWSVGMLTRLTRERDLPTRLAAESIAALDSALGRGRPTLDSTFESGAAVALRHLPVLLLTDARARTSGRHDAAGPDGSTAAIRRWLEACPAIATDENGQERVLCDGLEHILLNAREPEEDLGVFEAITAVAERIKWRQGGPARGRLLDWFRDPRVSESDLRVLTAAIAGKSGAEGVDQTMILSVNPQPDDRSRLRARYASAWSIEGAGRERASQHWLDAARATLEAAPSKNPVDQLKDAAAIARLNEAARLLWRGEGNAAESLLREAETVQGIGPLIVPQAPPVAVLTFSLTGRGADGTWAERYFAAERNIPVRLQLLDELEQGGRPIGTVDAAILVQEAVIGSPIQVRYAAARLAGQLADEAAVVAAALDELPLAPKTRSTADMMERVARQTLPSITDPDWELITRRALVERLLGMLAGGSTEATMEHYATLIADSYLRAAGQEPGRGAGAAADGAHRGAELLWAAVRAEAEAVAPVTAAPIPLDQIDRRRLGRMTLASGPVQAFAAEQVSIAEASAYVAAGERPTAAKRIDAVISRMQAARRAASHVFEQIIATERAILELWLLRFAQEPGGAI